MTTKQHNHSFRRSILLLVGILVGACLVLITLNLSSGPRLRWTEINATQAAKQPNQRLTMHANQPLKKVSEQQVVVEPQAAFTVATSGETVSILFTEKLRYHTNYTVTINDLSNSNQTNRTATFRHSFRTHDPTIYYVKRHHEVGDSSRFSRRKQPDQIMSTTLAATQSTAIYSAPKIQDFVADERTMIVATLNDAHTSSLTSVDIDSGKATDIPLPAVGKLTDLHISPDKRLAGFRFSSIEESANKQYDEALFVLNLSDRQLKRINGPNRQPIRAVDWTFAPDNTTILAQTSDLDLFLIDTRKDQNILPLGQFNEMTNFSHTGDKISLAKRGEPVILDSMTRASTSPQFEPIDGEPSHLVELRLLSNGDGHIARLAVDNYAAEISRAYFNLSTPRLKKTIYQADTRQVDIVSFAMSPNDEYLVVTQSADKTKGYDAYPDVNMPHTPKTLLIDTRTGKQIKQIDGFRLEWD